MLPQRIVAFERISHSSSCNDFCSYFIQMCRTLFCLGSLKLNTGKTETQRLTCDIHTISRHTCCLGNNVWQFVLGIIGRYPSVSKSNQLHVISFSVFSNSNIRVYRTKFL